MENNFFSCAFDRGISSKIFSTTLYLRGTPDQQKIFPSFYNSLALTLIVKELYHFIPRKQNCQFSYLPNCSVSWKGSTQAISAPTWYTFIS